MAEKDISYELIEVDLQNKTEELFRLNPYGKVPVLVDGDYVIYESAIINEYLEEKFPKVALMPKDLHQKAQTRIWIDFCNTRLQQAAGNYRHGIEPEKAIKKVNEYLDTLNKTMADKDYIVGEYSLADITYIPFFVRQDHYGVNIDNRWPHVKRWMNRLLSRPAVSTTP